MSNFYIKEAEKYDLTAIAALWNEVFGDSLSFINSFFNCFFSKNLIIAEQNSKIIAMATLLDASYNNINGINCPMWYVYACATSPEYRNMGIMKQILDYIYNSSLKKDKKGIIVLPASESLYTYYKNLGFKTHFEITKQTIVFSNEKKTISNNFSLIKINPSKYNNLRSSFLQDIESIVFFDCHFDFIEKYLNISFYQIVDNNIVIALCAVFVSKEEKLTIKELLCNKEYDSKEIVSFVSLQYSKNIVEFYSPSGGGKNNAGIKINKTAMIKSQFIKQNSFGYFNFGLE